MVPTPLENRSFLLLLTAVSLAFAVILFPFWGAIFWSVAITIIFEPVFLRLNRVLKGRRNLAALLTLLCSMLVVILPLTLIALQVVQEATALYQRFNRGELRLGDMLAQLEAAFPIIPQLLQDIGIDTQAIVDRLSSFAVNSSRFLAEEAVSAGQSTVSFVISLAIMLYLTFFMFRDGDRLLGLIVQALPFGDEREHRLLAKFSEVTRATVKGNIIVAIVQGSLGGIIFAVLGLPAAVLWGVLMAFLSLIPAVGAFLVWGPAAIYLLAIGDWLSGTVLIAFGAIVIGLADNLLRPILVGRDTKLPDYVVLISTLGGLVLLGINGFVIGPLIAALFMTVWDIFVQDFGPGKRDSGSTNGTD